MQLELQQRVALHRRAQESPDAENSGSETVPIRARAATSPLKARASVRKGLGCREHLLGLRQQPLPPDGQLHPARRPVEQRHAELVLERLDLGAQRGLADVQSLGGPGQVAGLGHDTKLRN